MSSSPSAFQQGYPFDLKRFPEEEDLLLDETDLKRKNVVYCRKEILHQMKCTHWAKEDYLAYNKDPEDHTQWMHYHLQRCYTPYMDAVGCLVKLKDREIQRMKRRAGPEEWQVLKEKWIQDVARKVGETRAKQMWEMNTNMKEMFEETRRRDGPLYGEKPIKDSDDNLHKQTPKKVAKATGYSSSTAIPTATGYSPINNPSHDELESLFARAKQHQLQQERANNEAKPSKKSFWSFGSS